MIRHDLQDLGGGTLGGVLADRARWAPDNVALVFQTQQFTYRDLDQQATAIGAGLMALGFGKGDAASVLMTNRPEYVLLLGGLARAGLVLVPVNAAYRGAFLQHALEHSEAKLLITESRLGDALLTLGQLPAGLRTIVYVDGVPPNVPSGDVTVLSWDEMLANGSPNQEFPVLGPSDTSAISFTSGTTGKSKGVVSPHLQGLVMAQEAARAFGITPRDRMYTCMPMFHGMAQVTTGLTAIYAGATMILSPRFTVGGFFDEVRESGATQFNALGSMLQMLLSAPPSPRDREHEVEWIFSAPAPADVLYRFERRFGVKVIEGYGQTETKNVLYNPRDARKIGSMGKPTATSIIEVHDEHGNPVAPGEVGEIVYRPRIANIMMKEYYREPGPTLAGMRGLWWHTGDLGSVDADGYFYFFDRKTDSLRRRGENISSQELEAVLAAFPGVREAAAIGTRSAIGDVDVLVVLEAPSAEALDFAALFAHSAKLLPRFMVPRYYRVVPSLPRTPTGKVQKTVLREQGVTEDTWDSAAAGFDVPR